jgi:4-hydroxyphenylpyruvate dioxygenase
MLCGSTLRACALHDAVPAVAAAGFDALSAWGIMVARSLDAGWSLADLRRLLDDVGVALDCVEPVADWAPGADATDAIPMADLLDMAVALGSRMVLASTNGVGDATDPAVVAGLATLAERAGERGLLVGLEFLGWGAVRDLPTAWAMVQAADRPSLRLVFDTWHQRRGTGTDDDIDAVPASMITAIQLADGPAMGEDDLVLEARYRRQLPGEGAMDVAGQLHRLADHGVQAPVGVEVWREGNQDDPAAAARRAFAALAAVLPA